jgi:hypothetical protein
LPDPAIFQPKTGPEKLSPKESGSLFTEYLFFPRQISRALLYKDHHDLLQIT